MKKVVLTLLVILAVLAFSSCQLEIVFNEIAGTWLFSDSSTLFLMYDENYPDEIIFDIGLGYDADADTYGYWCYGDGTISSNTITGTYDYNGPGDVSGLDKAITLTLTLSRDGKLTVSAQGEGPLNGKTFSDGVLQAIQE